MKLIILIALLTAAPAHAAITFFGSSGNPVRGGSLDGNPQPVAITPPASMQVNDYVIVLWAGVNSPTMTNISISNTGGQTWTSETFQGSGANGLHSARLFHTRFSGVWSADPSFTATAITGDVFGGIMIVFRGVDTSSAIDVALTQGTFAAVNDVTIPGITTTTSGAMVVALWMGGENNPWTLQTGGWSQDVADWINNFGSTYAMSYAYKIVDAAASGDVTNRQSGSATGGFRYIIALRAEDGESEPPPPPPAAGANCVTPLCITQGEVNTWNARRVSGPYKSTGDVQTNSPGDWDRINSNANSFRAGSATAERWIGQAPASCWDYNSPSSMPSDSQGSSVRDTAFRYLLAADANDLNHVTSALLDQAAQTGTNFNDSTRWNPNAATGTCFYGDGNSWRISNWISRLMLAYDYIHSGLSAGNRTTIENWFLSYANLVNTSTNRLIVLRYPNRDSDDYSAKSYPNSCVQPNALHFGGPVHCDFSEGWSNRSLTHIRAMAMAAIIVNNATLKARAKRHVKERIRFNTWFVDGANVDGEFHRSIAEGTSPAIPTHGWHYAGLSIGSMMAIADIFARSGDTELYDYSVSVGDHDGFFVAAGGPKSILAMTLGFLDYMDGTIIRCGSANAANCSNSDYNIDSVDELNAWARVYDIWTAQGNVYWRNSTITSKYRRQTAGAPAYPASPSNPGGANTWSEWGVHPGTLFMYGQMEDSPANPFIPNRRGASARNRGRAFQ